MSIRQGRSEDACRMERRRKDLAFLNRLAIGVAIGAIGGGVMRTLDRRGAS